MAEGVGFEPTRERNPLPVFKTGALNHSATLPYFDLTTISVSPARAQAAATRLPALSHFGPRGGGVFSDQAPGLG